MGKGLASFQQRFRAMPAAVRQSVDPAILDAAEDMAGEMKALAPKISGKLAASIAVTGPGQSTPAHSRPGGSMVVPENSVAITVGNSSVRYPHLVEFGTKKTAAKPFFFAGYILKRQGAARTIKAAIRRAVRGGS